MIDIDVVIVAFNSAADLAEAVPAALAIPGAGSVVVVDHGSDDSATLAKSLGARACRDPSNPGFGAGQNRGAAMGSAPLVLLLNPDARIDPEAIARGAHLFADDPCIGAVQGPIVSRRTGRAERSHGTLGPLHLLGRALGARRMLSWPIGRAALHRVPSLGDYVDRVPDHAIDVRSLSATALLVRRSAFEAVGGFDEGFFLYGEDLDLCARLVADGWRLCALAGPWATHEDGSSSESWVDREIAWFEGTMRFVHRWWRPLPRMVAVLAALLRAATVAVRSPRRWREALVRMVIHPIRTPSAGPHHRDA